MRIDFIKSKELLKGGVVIGSRWRKYFLCEKSKDPFEESTYDDILILDIKDGYAKYKILNGVWEGAEESCPIWMINYKDNYQL